MSIGLNSPIQLQLPNFPESELPPAVRQMAEQLYISIWNLVRAFQEQCGVGGWPQSDWSQVTPSMSLLTANLNRLYAPASEGIIHGALINMWNDAGTLRVRNANAANNARFACGFCNVPGGVSSGASGEFILGAGLMPVSGVIPGTRYFLSTTDGLISPTPPGAAGNIRQYVAVGISSSSVFYFNGGDFVQL